MSILEILTALSFGEIHPPVSLLWSYEKKRQYSTLIELSFTRVVNLNVSFIDCTFEASGWKMSRTHFTMHRQSLDIYKIQPGILICFQQSFAFKTIPSNPSINVYHWNDLDLEL